MNSLCVEFIFSAVTLYTTMRALGRVTFVRNTRAWASMASADRCVDGPVHDAGTMLVMDESKIHDDSHAGGTVKPISCLNAIWEHDGIVIQILVLLGPKWSVSLGSTCRGLRKHYKCDPVVGVYDYVCLSCSLL